MNLFRMQCFIAVAKHLSLSKAATEMFITQPSMTQQMNALEDELDITLFIRGRRGLVLTEAGEYVRQNFSAILSQYEEMKTNLKTMQISGYGKVRVGFHGPSNWAYMLGLLKAFHRQYPNVKVELTADTWVCLREQIRNRDLDVAFIESSELVSEADIDSVELIHSGFSVLLPKGHRLADRSSLTLEDLSGENLISPDFSISPALMEQFIRDGNKEELLSENRMQGNTYEACSLLVASGYGITMLPSFLCSVSPDLVSVPLEIDTRVNIAIAWHKANINTATRQFVNLACSYRWE